MRRLLLIAAIGLSATNISSAQELNPTPTIEPTLHQAGESVISWDFGRASDWIDLLAAAAPCFAVMLLIGIVIGFIFRRHDERVADYVSMIIGALAYALLLWRYHSPNEWSWRQPIVSAIYQIWPAGITCVGPTLVGAAIARWLMSRRAKHLAKRGSLNPKR